MSHCWNFGFVGDFGVKIFCSDDDWGFRARRKIFYSLENSDLSLFCMLMFPHLICIN